jgi:hypothetical protein
MQFCRASHDKRMLYQPMISHKAIPSERNQKEVPKYVFRNHPSANESASCGSIVMTWFAFLMGRSCQNDDHFVFLASQNPICSFSSESPFFIPRISDVRLEKRKSNHQISSARKRTIINK